MHPHRAAEHSSKLSNASGAPSAPVEAYGDLRRAAARVRALLPSGNRSASSSGALKMPEDRLGTAAAGAVFGLERGDLLVALCAFGVLQLERN